MDINENIAIYCYRRGGTYDGICDLCLKDFPTYNDLKTHKNICINNKFVMNVLWLNVSLANYVQAVKSAPRIKDHLWCCQCLRVPTSSVFHGYTWLENEGCVLHATILAAKKERRVERTKRGRKRKETALLILSNLYIIVTLFCSFVCCPQLSMFLMLCFVNKFQFYLLFLQQPRTH